MPLIGDHIKVGRCYGMIIGGKLIIAKVIQIYPLDINVAPKLDGMRDRKFPSVTESIVRWAWRDAAGSGKWRRLAGMAASGLRFCSRIGSRLRWLEI